MSYTINLLKDNKLRVVHCPFCAGSVQPVYRINLRLAGKCSNCGTIGIFDMPSHEEVHTFYQGFSFQTNISQYSRVKSSHLERWLHSLCDGGSTMLDVGGGGGFFAKAFEEFGLGRSTYIDLDQEACDFARNKMRLARVIYDSVENIESHVHGQKFDFIYCRHVIEHLVDPVSLILACASLLSKGGTFVLQCPNGRSKEGLLYPAYWRRFLRGVARDNGWSKAKAIHFSLTRNYGWGLDPIRHLWAISGKGIEAVFRNNPEFVVEISTATLCDPVFSPYWQPSNRREAIAGAFSSALVNKVFDGMHLVATIHRR